MANIRFSFRNHADTAVLTSNYSFATNLPLTNLQRQERYRTARTTTAADHEYKLAWAAPVTVAMAATRLHNFTSAVTIATPTYSDAAFTTSIAANAAANAFAYTGFDGNDILTEIDFRLLKNTARYLTSSSSVQSMKFVVANSANPDGYFDISRLWVGDYFEMFYQLPYGGGGFKFDDFSVQGRAFDGSVITDRGPQGRRLELSASQCKSTDWAKLLSGLRYVGKHRDLFVSVFPGDGTWKEAYYQGLFKVEDVSIFDQNFYDHASQKITLIES